MASLLKALHELVEQHHLATGDHQPVHSIEVVFPTPVVFFSTLEEERVVASLLQLSNDIQKGYLPSFAALQKQRRCLDSESAVSGGNRNMAIVVAWAGKAVLFASA